MRGKPVHYQVIIKTGDVRYGGTDANVYIVFIGAAGKTAKLFMDNTQDNFERNRTEEFTLQAMNVGSIQSVVVGHDNTGPGAGWYCESIRVRKYFSREEIADQLAEYRKLLKSHQQRKQFKDDHLEDDTSSEQDPAGQLLEDRLAEMFDRNGKVVKLPAFEEYLFTCNKWFATDEGDGLVERELPVSTRTLYFQEK